MKRITLILGVVAVMAAMIVALAAPAMAKDNDGNNNGGNNNRVASDRGHLDNRADRDEGNLFVRPFVRPVPPVVTEPVNTTTVVKPGDTLFGIAQEELGPDATPQLLPDEVNRIHDLNRDRIGDNPHMIFPGQELRMPLHR